MKQYWKWAALAAAVVLYGLAVQCCAQAGQQAAYPQGTLAEPISSARVSDILRQESQGEEALRFCFWGQGQEGEVACCATGRRASAALLPVAGYPALLDGEALTWQEGCYLDEKTAQALFGTDQCAGQILEFRGMALPVLGILPLPQPTVMFAAQAEDSLNRCMIEGEKGQGQKALLRWNLSGELFDFFPYWALCRNLLLLFPGGLGIWCCKTLRKKGKWHSLGAWALAGALLVLGWKLLVIPPEMIPSRWSDFSFWGTLWQSQKDRAWAIAHTPLSSRQLQMLANMVKSMVSAIGSLALALWGMGRNRYADIAH